MADIPAPQDRLQPALLDRLTDDDPGSQVEPRERRVMSRNRMRRAVLRDLAWLFNATRPTTGAETGRSSYAARSVIAFGLPVLSGQSAASMDVTDLERAIHQAILDFEPRILPATLHVRALEVEQLGHHNVVGVEIRGDLWAQPVPLEILVRTKIDLETGQVEIADLAGSATE